MFPNSPVYNGKITNDSLTAIFVEKQHGEVSDEGHTFGTFNLDYAESPDIAAGPYVSEGPEPATAYVPNPSSPGPSMNAADKPDAPESFGQTRSQAYGEGDGALTNPSSTAAVISQQTVGTYSMGSSTNS
jgi:hypothetical protein